MRLLATQREHILLVMFIFFMFPAALFAANESAIQFKHFSDYKKMYATKFSKPNIFRVHYKAQLVINDRTPDPVFKNNSWKLVMRRGIYRAQVDKAMSDLHHYFLGYSTDLDFVENNGDYYIARRLYTHFKKLDDKKGRLISNSNNTYYIKGYQLLDDGTLVKARIQKKFTGFGKIAALTEFFGESDAEIHNYGIQESDTELRVIAYDNEHSLDFDVDNQGPYTLEKNLTRDLGPSFIQMTWFKNEKLQMQQKIASTPFAVIEAMIRKNITVSRLNEIRWILNKILSEPKLYPDYDVNEVKKQLERVDKLDPNNFSVDRIVADLKIRYVKLQKQFTQ